MALRPLHTDQRPIGIYDAVDSETTSFLGGEVCSFTSLILPDVDHAASDISDGYVGTTTKRRPAVTKTLVAGMRPLFLADEGTDKYGTLFGSVVGGTVGTIVTGGAVLGPHTATGSGKITLWGLGLYDVTLDAVDTNGATGLAPTNATLTVGAAVYATAAGLLTPDVSSAFEAVRVGTFVEFTTDGSLVTTPSYLVSALNSPTGGAAGLLGFTRAVVHFAQGV